MIKKYANSILIIIFSFLIYFSLYYKFDISGGGASTDLNTHWLYMKLLNENLNNLFNIELGKDFKLLHFPLHHLLFSRVDFLMTDIKNYLLFYMILSLFFPFLFYKICCERFPSIKKENILYYSIIIYSLPFFQASAVWGNSHITALFFWLFSILFLNRSTRSLKPNTLLVLSSFIFLTLASYTRQYYVIFFPYYLTLIYKKKIQLFIFSIIACSFLALPGLFFLYMNPNLFFGLKMEITNFQSSILICLSMFTFYLTPFFISNFKKNFFEMKKIFISSKNILLLFALTIILIFLCTKFEYNSLIGGGAIYKVSQIIFKNNFIFFISSFIGMFLIFFYKSNKIEFNILIFSMILPFSSGIYIFQKYFEPLIFILIFLFFDEKKIEYILQDKNKFIFFYFVFYLIGTFFYNNF